MGVPEGASSYLDFLPGIYQDSEFLGRFLLIFEHILSPLDRTAGSIADYFDASLTPEDFLPWLGSWLGMVVDARIPQENKREMIRSAPDLYRWRGTKRGMREFLRLATGIEPEVIEPTLSEIAGNRNLAYRFTVRFRLPAGASLARSYVEALDGATTSTGPARPAPAAGGRATVPGRGPGRPRRTSPSELRVRPCLRG